MSLVVHIMGTVITNVLQHGALQLYGETQEPVIKVLPVFGLSLVRKLALQVHDG